MPDITEVLDEYCESVYGHTNWGYTSTYSKEELADKSKYDLELDNSIVIWYEALKEEERQQTYCTSCKKITNSSRADYQDEFTCNDCGAEVQEEE